MLLDLTDAERTAEKLSDETLAKAVRLFRDTGIVLVPGIYEPTFLESVRAAYEIELDRYLEGKGGLEALEGKTFGKNHIGFFPPLFPPVADNRIIAHPVVVQLLKALLGDDLQCSFFHTNTAMPDSGIQPIHRDQQPLFRTEMSAAHPVSHIVLNIPLCEFSVANGSTEYWPGTHLIVDRRAEDAGRLEERAAHLPSVRLNMPLGSFALRDLRAWHRGMPNLADYPRTMFAIVYQREFVTYVPTTVPRSTWESWSEDARRIFRRNRVVEDADHRSLTWEEMR
ncbi:MAG: phytanoyl-CoA dioxygenase family protein [Capsulimonadales bacterium]|nr:phytanoyl-CoA dioxygenase family protein [Capsulimonadales bacterium]